MRKRIRFTTALDVFEAFETLRGDIGAEPADEPSIAYLKALAVSATPEDAIGFCAHLLSRRDAVLWGARCVTRLCARLSAEEAKLIEAAEDWLRHQDETSRRAALALAGGADRRLAATWAALAAAWSGGSMTNDGFGPVPCPPYLTHKAANAAVLLAIATRGVKARRNLVGDCVDWGIEIATGEAPEVARPIDEPSGR
ncbi:hypothetical protein [Zavarzinia sp.]|uniref:DUF6931 family protein n=1 Tax=Zavarzinia sp. TaxID=2027920 RepID=UPI0035699290